VTKHRLEAFSDGVLAIIITIMVLELHAPEHAARLSDLRPLIPTLLSYVLSFLYVGIYWNNHHHMLHAATRVSGGMLWANLHLLFWLSLIPFVTAWMGGNEFAAVPTALYGVVLLMAAIAYRLLQRTIVSLHGGGALLARAIGRDRKGLASVLLYLAAILLAPIRPGAACGIYALVAGMWLIPDRRIERALEQTEAP
jgi:uncharacterized membrane protein